VIKMQRLFLKVDSDVVLLSKMHYHNNLSMQKTIPECIATSSVKVIHPGRHEK